MGRFKPHESLKWLRLKEFQSRKQDKKETVDDFFAVIKEMGRKLHKSDNDILDTFVAGLLPIISKFVMTRSPKDLDEALDYARKASILEDPQDQKLEVAITSLTDNVGRLETEFRRYTNNEAPKPNFSNHQHRNYTRTYQPETFRRQYNYQVDRRNYDYPQRHFGNSRGPHTNHHRYYNQNNNHQGQNPFKKINTCKHCGKLHYGECRFKYVKCLGCGRIGHKVSICRFQNK